MNIKELNKLSVQGKIKAGIWLAFLFLITASSGVVAEAEIVIHTQSQQQNPNQPPSTQPPKKASSQLIPKKQENLPSPTFFDTLKPISRMQDVPANASCIQVLGEADFSLGDQAFMRQMAIRNALKNASIYRNTTVTSKEKVQAFQLKQSQTHFTSHSRIVGFSILREGENLVQTTKPCRFCDEAEQEKLNPPTYQVVLKVCLTDEKAGCPNLPVNFYQVPIVIAQPLVQFPEQARDLSNLVRGVQSELIRRLHQQKYLNAKPLNHALGIQKGQLIQPNLDPDLLDELRASTQAQLVLLPVIRSTALVTEPGSLLNRVKQFYLYDAEPDKRHLEVDYFWVDLYRQKVVAQHRLGFDIEGDVVVGRDKPVGTSAFFSTDTGKVFDLLLDQMVEQAQNFLKCQNLVSEVVEKRDQEVIVPISQETGIQVGDYLAVYHKDGAALNVQNYNLGFDLRPSGFIQVTRVMPNFIVAKVSGESKYAISVGDWVKAW